MTNLIDVKVEPVDSLLNNDIKSKAIFVSENYQNEVAKFKEEMADEVIYNETFDTFVHDSEMKIEIVKNDLEKEWLVKIEKVIGYESVEPNTKDLENILEQTSSKAEYIKEEVSREVTQEKHLEASREKLYQSQNCCDLSSQNLLLIQKKPRSRKKNFGCNYCGKKFRDNADLTNHLRVHTGEKPFKCDICEKSFCRKSQLNIHTMTHTRKKPFKCDICNETFIYKSVLLSHKLIHSGYKRYSCDQCNKVFVHKSGLDRHKLRHTIEKTYKCDVCGKCLNHKSTLIKHRVVHTGETPFSCDICNKLFNRKSNLQRHELTVHKNLIIG